MSQQKQDSAAEALRTVLKITDAVSRCSNATDLIERALDAIVAYTRFPCCGFFQLDSTGTWAEMVGHRNVSPEVYAHARRLPLEGSLTGLAIRTGCVVTTSDIAHDDRVEPATRQALAQEGYVEVASIPLICRDQVLGTINLIFRADDSLSQPERDTLLSIGQTIAIALAQRLGDDERLMLQERLRKAEQIERLGLLAGGMAHDFNNHLTSILGNISLCKSLLQVDAGGSDEPLELLDQAQAATERAAMLVQKLLTFSKGGTPVLRSTTELGELVRRSAMRAAKGSHVRLQCVIEPSLPVTSIDGAQISQLVESLVSNAIEASNADGTVSVAVTRIVQEHPSDRDWIRIAVTDDGCGIPPEHQPRVCDPYFSTKHGACGLGLSIVQSIAVAHRGHLRVVSEVGVGTTLLIDLPCGDRNSEHEPVERRSSSERSVAARILVMDDEPSILALMRRTLERCGHRVVTVSGGTQAVLACEDAIRAGHPFDLAVLDLTIVGGLGGRETLPRIRALIPTLSAIVCSGYSDDAVMAKYSSYGFDAALSKPFTTQQLGTVVSKVLGRSSLSSANGQIPSAR